MALKSDSCAGLWKDRGEVVRVWWAENQGVSERNRVPGSQAYSRGWGSRSSGGKPEQQDGGLGLRGQSWWPDKGSVHWHTWTCWGPSCTVLWGRLSTVFQSAVERFIWLPQTKAIFPVHIIRMELILVASLMMQSMYLGFGGEDGGVVWLDAMSQSSGAGQVCWSFKFFINADLNVWFHCITCT
jgi:hypothetical protein